MHIRVSIDLPVSVATAWTALADIHSHVDWMADAHSITFITPQESGPGATFICDTRIGPFRLRDRMTMTEWVAGACMGVRHEGLVTGEGRFSLSADPARMIWEETLSLPWYFGGRLGELVARPLLTHVWRGNLRRFVAHVVSSAS